MKIKFLWIGFIVLTASFVLAGDADIFGTWIVEYPRALGTATAYFGETCFSFEPAGSRLNGTVSSSEGTFPISNGKIRGDEISFVVIRKSAEREIKLKYEGKVSLNEIRFELEIEGAQKAPLGFTARREFLRHNDYIPRRITVPEPPIPNRLRP